MLAKDRANNNTAELKENLNSSPECLVFCVHRSKVSHQAS